MKTVYVVDDNSGRGGGHRSRVSLWENTLSPVLLILISYRGHSRDDSRPLAPGMRRYPNPQSQKYFIDLDPLEVERFRSKLETDGHLDRNSITDAEEEAMREEAALHGDELDFENEEDDGYCEVTRQVIRP